MKIENYSKKIFQKVLQKRSFGITITATVLFFGIFLTPNRADALIFSLQKTQNQTVHAGDTILTSIMVNTEGQEINALDGIITVDGPASVKTITTGGSVFNLWPNKPSLNGNQISFVGGSTGGVSGTYLKLLTLAITPVSSGQIVLTVKGSSVAYKNDGRATRIPVPETPLYIIAEPAPTDSELAAGQGKPPVNDLATMILGDKTPPEKFTIELGQDPSIYDGKYFISFNTTDTDSGINRYEVEENDSPIVRSGDTYILQDQNLNSFITVNAIDNAGNSRIETLQLHGLPNQHLILKNTLTVVTLIILIYLLVRLSRKRKKSKPRR